MQSVYLCKTVRNGIFMCYEELGFVTTHIYSSATATSRVTYDGMAWLVTYSFYSQCYSLLYTYMRKCLICHIFCFCVIPTYGALLYSIVRL
jgi:hypothetical protein